tara:strand:- start:3594 stop:3761 length:168 start_codon:yes stop_codon:yes gene_type:complete
LLNIYKFLNVNIYINSEKYEFKKILKKSVKKAKKYKKNVKICNFFKKILQKIGKK